MTADQEVKLRRDSCRNWLVVWVDEEPTGCYRDDADGNSKALKHAKVAVREGSSEVCVHLVFPNGNWKTVFSHGCGA